MNFKKDKKSVKKLDLYKNIYYNVYVQHEWAFSSVGQSTRLITGWSGVRIPEGPPLFICLTWVGARVAKGGRL